MGEGEICLSTQQKKVYKADLVSADCQEALLRDFRGMGHRVVFIGKGKLDREELIQQASPSPHLPVSRLPLSA